MTERLTSFFILLGGALAVLALWYLSVVIVRRDTRRRGMPPLERKAWIAAAAALPLFGFALYLFAHVLRRYLQPAPQPELPEPHVTAVKVYPIQPQPAPWSEQIIPGTALDDTAAAHTNGKAAVMLYDTDPVKTSATISAPVHGLRGHFVLVAIDGAHAGQQFDLAALPQRVGRGDEAAINLESDLNVSRSHAEVYEWGGTLRIRDLGSTHGTQVNGVPVTDQAIVPGDRINVGGTTLILREIP